MADLKEKTLYSVHSEKLSGRDHKTYFSDHYAGYNLLYHDAYEVDLHITRNIDAEHLSALEVNAKILDLMRSGCGHIVVENPGAKHSMGVGILNRLRLIFKGSLGYFSVGLIDGPNVQITGRVGWGCGENMMSGTVVIEKNAGSSFGASLRGGDLVCKGDVGSRTGISMKGGTLIVGGRTGYLSGFMMQRGRMIILGDADENLGDSMYDGTIYVGGKIRSLGIDAVLADLTEYDCVWLKRKLKLYNLDTPNSVESMQKIVAGKKLWNYDKLEPTEKKIIV